MPGPISKALRYIHELHDMMLNEDQRHLEELQKNNSEVSNR